MSTFPRSLVAAVALAFVLPVVGIAACALERRNNSVPGVLQSAQRESRMIARPINLTGRTTLSVLDQGPHDGPVVVLLHGFVDSWRSFERLLPHLPPSLRVVAVTQRGHGDSSKRIDRYSVPVLTDDLLALLDVLHIDRPLLVGHSMGSAIALRFALDHAARTRGLVLISTPSSVAGSPEARLYWKGVLADLRDPIPLDFLRSLAAQDFVKPVPPEILDTLANESAKVPLHVWRGVLEARWRSEGNYANQLDQLRVPTLLMWGTRDARCPRSTQDALLAGIQGSRLVAFEGAGHMLHIEEPEQVAREISAFAGDL